MTKNFYELSIKPSSAYDLICDFIFSLGVTCIEEKDGNIIIRDESSLDNLLFGVKEFAKKLGNLCNQSIEIQSKIEVKRSCDWVKRYQNSVQPIEVGKFYIRPSWYEKKDEFINIIIDPALAFGSGHHETTFSCIELIEKYAKTGFCALDVGCGSGILGIVMSKLSLNVDACDTDEQCVFSASQNTLKNGVKFANLWTGSIVNLDKKYDLIVANIVFDVIIVLQNDLEKCLKSGGILILSGILNKEKMQGKFANLTLIEIKTMNEWSSFVYKKENL